MADRAHLRVPGRFAAGAAARILGLLAVGAPAVALREVDALIVVLMFAVVWAVAITLSAFPRAPVLPGLTIEAMAVAAACGVALVQTQMLHLSALAVTPFIGGLCLGVRGLVVTMLTQITMLAAVLLALSAWPNAAQQGELFAGYVLAMAAGLAGGGLRSIQASREQLTPYRDARLLLGRLLELADVLDAGLDTPSVGARLVARFQDHVPSVEASLWSVVDEGPTPIVTGSLSEAADHAARGARPPDLVRTASTGARAVVDGEAFAVSLGTVAGRALVLEGRVSPGLQVGRRALAVRLHAAAEELRPLAMQLDTSLVFAEVTHAATTSERRRLAREMHDGLAQDIASMGYLVDAVADGPLPEATRAQVDLLRSTITRVVAEVRTSVTALRMDADTIASLGEAVAALARRLSDASGISIRCTVDERTARLSPQVEAELLRIAQEALTNAVKHSGASEIDVECRVDAPRARLVVRDNGHGLRTAGRCDSHGLAIMRERAALVGADLHVDSDSAGTVVFLSLGRRLQRAHAHPGGIPA